MATAGLQLEAEWDRKKSLEQRGITVVTTSGSLVTLVFAAVTIVSKGTHFANLFEHEHHLIATGLWLFVAAAVLGLFSNVPLPGYRAIRSHLLNELFEEAQSGQLIQGALLKNELDVLRAARKMNRLKSYGLAAALGCEIGAAIFLVVSVAYIVGHS